MRWGAVVAVVGAMIAVMKALIAVVVVVVVVAVGGGGATATATPTQIMNNMVGESCAQYTLVEVKFHGALGMLDVADRVKPVADIDIGRMRWACEVLDGTKRFRKVFGDIAQRGGLYPKGALGPTMLRQTERKGTMVSLVLDWSVVIVGPVLPRACPSHAVREPFQPGFPKLRTG